MFSNRHISAIDGLRGLICSEDKGTASTDSLDCSDWLCQAKTFMKEVGRDFKVIIRSGSLAQLLLSYI